mgnify:FL=1|jgi:hypothetical protein|tara:strand:+ start:848 stop:1684 length:837 start_codon:yes stop_codon:yes gene_type:complete
MGKLKHSKFKNTGILFELLVRQIASDTLSDNTCYATKIIQNHFRKGSQLARELKLYQSLTKENFDSEYKASEFLNIILKERAKLNEGVLRREKYNLIKSIKDSYIIEDFFKYRVSNYREMASAYKLFENVESTSPKEYVECKNTIFEAITTDKVVIKEEKVSEEYSKQPKEVRLLAYKFLVDSFNSKYSGLSESQKLILKNYINNIDNSDTLRKFVVSEVAKLRRELKSIKISDKVTKIKLNETVNLISELTKHKVINENQILALLRYHQLLQELRRK